MANEKRIGALWYPKTQSEKAPFLRNQPDEKDEMVREIDEYVSFLEMNMSKNKESS